MCAETGAGCDMTGQEQQELSRALGHLEGTVETGFQSVNARLDEMDATMIRLHDSESGKRGELEKRVRLLESWKNWVLGIGSAVGAVIGAAGTWLAGGAGK